MATPADRRSERSSLGGGGVWGVKTLLRSAGELFLSNRRGLKICRRRSDSFSDPFPRLFHTVENSD